MSGGEVPPTFRFEQTIEYETPDSLDQCSAGDLSTSQGP